jgi:hypothetical protein
MEKEKKIRQDSKKFKKKYWELEIKTKKWEGTL